LSEIETINPNYFRLVLSSQVSLAIAHPAHLPLS